MKQPSRISPPMIGGTSLLVIFAVLCMSVFSLLSLRTAMAAQRASHVAAEQVTAYYEADLQAQTIFAKLRSGETVPGVEETDGMYRFSCPFSGTQSLEVTLQKTGVHWTVLRWQTVAQPPVSNQTLPVWTGQ